MTRPAGSHPLDQSQILLATVDALPWPYEILGLVEATMSAAAGIVPTAHLMARLQEQARATRRSGVSSTRRPELAPVRMPTLACGHRLHQRTIMCGSREASCRPCRVRGCLPGLEQSGRPHAQAPPARGHQRGSTGQPRSA